MSMQTTWTASRHAGVAPASQYAASSAVRPCTCPSSPCRPSRSKKQVCHRSASSDVLPGLLVDGEPGPAAAVLIDAQVRHRRHGLVQHRVRGGGERLVGDRPGDPGVPGRLRRGDPRSVTSAPACSRSRAVIRHRGGSGGTHSVNVLRGHSRLPHLRRTLTQRRSTGSAARRTSRGRASTVSCTRPETVPHSGHAAAAG